MTPLDHGYRKCDVCGVWRRPGMFVEARVHKNTEVGVLITNEVKCSDGCITRQVCSCGEYLPHEKACDYTRDAEVM